MYCNPKFKDMEIGGCFLFPNRDQGYGSDMARVSTAARYYHRRGMKFLVRLTRDKKEGICVRVE